MTVKNEIETLRIKGARKKHPMEKKYPGHPCMEFSTAHYKFFEDLTEDEKQWFLNKTLVFEEEVTAVFFDSLQVGDVIGLGLMKAYPEEFDTAGPAAYQLEVVKIYEGQDKIRVKNITFADSRFCGEIDLTFEEVSWALGAGFADVLKRDGKLFGVSEEVEYKINIIKPAEEEEIITNPQIKEE